MPSPVGHALGGVLVGLVLMPRSSFGTRRRSPTLGSELRRGKLLVTLALVACLPDVDFLWGRHGMETHSVGAAILVAGAVFVLIRGKPLPGVGAARLAVACGLAWGSHVLFDWLGSDDFPPLGVMAFWPFSNDFSFAYAYVFDTISRRYTLPGFWAHNLTAVAKEIVLLTPPVAALSWLRLRTK